MAAPAVAQPGDQVTAHGPLLLYYRMMRLFDRVFDQDPVRSCQWHANCAN